MVLFEEVWRTLSLIAASILREIAALAGLGVLWMVQLEEVWRTLSLIAASILREIAALAGLGVPQIANCSQHYLIIRYS